jgi:hypothetical protein
MRTRLAVALLLWVPAAAFAQSATPTPTAAAAASTPTASPTPAPPLPSAARVKIDDVRWVSFGAGVRTSFKAQEDGAPDGQSWMKDFDIDNMRLYTSGQISPRLAAAFNLDYQKETPENTGPPVAEKLRLLDAIAKLRLSDALQIWGGRLHPPSDRSNMDGPYYQATYQPPFVSRYPAIFAGRDDGVVAWGTLHGGRYKYKAGVFEGRDTNANRSDDLLFAASAMLNLWDGEPAFYNQSTYYGGKRIFALGGAVQHQKNGAASSAATPVAADFTAWSVDFLLEREIGGVATLEGAYYNYDTGDVADAFLPNDHGYFVLAGYLLPGSVGGARLQPHARWQRLGTRRALDVGVNLVGKGHIGRLSLVYTRDENTSAHTVQHRVLAGVQLQY